MLLGAGTWLLWPGQRALGVRAMRVADTFAGIPSVAKTGCAAAAPGLVITPNPLTSTAHLIADLRQDRRLWVGGLITSWFWLVGAVSLALLPPLMKDAVGGKSATRDVKLVLR